MEIGGVPKMFGGFRPSNRLGIGIFFFTNFDILAPPSERMCRLRALVVTLDDSAYQDGQ